MSQLATRKCVRHPAREAGARCLSCREHFCRECVVEHAGALLCAACLARVSIASSAPVARPRDWRAARELVFTGASVMLLWVVLYLFGQFLKAIPAKVHEGTVWNTLGILP